MGTRPSIDEIFGEAIEIESPVERESYLERACDGDQEQKRQLERLIHAHFHGGSILDSPVRALDSTTDQVIGESAGTQIGRYRLLQEIGQGGMGVVYMAGEAYGICPRAGCC